MPVASPTHSITHVDVFGGRISSPAARPVVAVGRSHARFHHGFDDVAIAARRRRLPTGRAIEER